MNTLDKSRPFAEVFGYAEYRYEQDGRQFDHFGNEVVQASKASKPATAPAGTTATIDGHAVDLEAQDRDVLYDLATNRMGLRLHTQLGKAKIIAAIKDKLASEQKPASQLDEQLQG